MGYVSSKVLVGAATFAVNFVSGAGVNAPGSAQPAAQRSHGVLAAPNMHAVAVYEQPDPEALRLRRKRKRGVSFSDQEDYDRRYGKVKVG